MATSAKCSNTSWKVEEIEPRGSRFKYYAVQCVKCGNPAGIMDYDNIGAAIEELEDKIEAINASIDNVADGINKILRKLN